MAIVAWLYSHSLLKPAQSIRASLLKQTSLGTSSDGVRAFIDKQQWHFDKDKNILNWRYLSSNNQYWHQDSKLNKVIVTNSISVDIGHYWLPLPIEVTAFWGLDASNQLIDIWVVKNMDGP